MKVKLFTLLFVILICIGMAVACSQDKDYGNKLPPDFPVDIPIIEGNIEESRFTKFETGKGYIVVIRTNISYNETIQYFKDAFKEKGVTSKFQEATNMSGTEQRMMFIEAYQEDFIILIEIVSGDDLTYVNYAVHLDK